MRDHTADGDLPRHITKMSSLIGDDVYHCKTCGGEGDTPGTIDHHEECPRTGGGGDA
jgi:hypothetical protein